MPLSLAVDQGNGIAPTYHRITRVVLSIDPPQTEVTLTSFMAKSQSDIGPHKHANASYTYTLPGLPNGINFATAQTWIYDQIKVRPEWSGATIVP